MWKSKLAEFRSSRGRVAQASSAVSSSRTAKLATAPATTAQAPLKQSFSATVKQQAQAQKKSSKVVVEDEWTESSSSAQSEIPGLGRLTPAQKEKFMRDALAAVNKIKGIADFNGEVTGFSSIVTFTWTRLTLS